MKRPITSYDVNTYEPTPSGALNSSSRGIELLLKILNAAKILQDRGFERPILQGTSIPFSNFSRRGKVLPKK